MSLCSSSSHVFGKRLKRYVFHLQSLYIELLLNGACNFIIQTLAEEIQKMTSTAQKRKMRLKERSLKRKNKKGGKVTEEKVRYIAPVISLQLLGMHHYNLFIFNFSTL